MLVNRFLINLRKLNTTDQLSSNSDAQHFSRFSVSFRIPESALGNIGEPLEHGQPEDVDGIEEDEVQVEIGQEVATLEASTSAAAADPEVLHISVKTM